MFRIKKLDIFIVKSFLLLFAGTFFICLFIFMMQFLWRYVDELVGKGLEMEILAQFFFLSGVTLIPLSLPLSILLASLITFGNFGERYELLSMKAAGISLLRVMRPLAILCGILGLISFYFQNVVGPSAQKELWTLLVSMRVKTPEVDIPERVFYNAIPGYNIYVKEKDKRTGELHDVLIYDMKEGFQQARIIWAERAKLEASADNQHIFFHFYNGEQFENLSGSAQQVGRNQPYRRESFKEKHAMIQFDTDFTKVDGSFLDQRADTKGMASIQLALDSLIHYADSAAYAIYERDKTQAYAPISMQLATDTLAPVATLSTLNVDSVYRILPTDQKLRIAQRAMTNVRSMRTGLEMESYNIQEAENNIRSHISGWHKKITLSLACVFFFFIGAPLGAIIRKGGLGMPVVISVLIFVLYYIIDSGATRTAKSGSVDPMLGTWISSLVLAPVGAWLTYKSNRDSVVFNKDLYVAFFQQIFGWRTSRHLTRKEVIIHTPSADVENRLAALAKACRTFLSTHHLKRLPSYIKMFFAPMAENPIRAIYKEQESIIEELSNHTDHYVINQLNAYPVLNPSGHVISIKPYLLRLLCGIFLPVGLVLYIRAYLFGRRLEKDLHAIADNSEKVIALLHRTAQHH